MTDPANRLRYWLAAFALPFITFAFCRMVWP